MKSGQIALIAFAVFTTVVAILLVLAIFVWPSDEPGFLEDRIPWTAADMPLSVCARDLRLDEGIETHASGALDHALSITNGRLGFVALTRVSNTSTDCDVIVRFGVAAEAGFRDPGGDAVWTAGEHLCTVSIVNVVGELETLTVQHELGHCLGLADDGDFPMSIMRDEQSPTPDRTIPPWISDRDRGLLRETYGAP